MTIESAPLMGSVPTLDMGIDVGTLPIDVGTLPIDFEVIALQVAESTSSVRFKIASMEIECVASRSASLSDAQLARIGSLKDASKALALAEEKLAGDTAAYSECMVLYSAASAELEVAKVSLENAAAGSEMDAALAVLEKAKANYSKAFAALEESKVNLADQESEVSAKTAELESLIASLDASLMAKVLDEIRVSSREAAEVEEVHVSEQGEEKERLKEDCSAERLLAEFIDRMADEISAEISARRTSQI